MRKFCTLSDQPAFESDGSTSGGHRPVCGELYKQVTSGAEHALIGQILYLIGVVYRGRVDVVAIFNQQPEKEYTEGIKINVLKGGRSIQKKNGYLRS